MMTICKPTMALVMLLCNLLTIVDAFGSHGTHPSPSILSHTNLQQQQNVAISSQRKQPWSVISRTRSGRAALFLQEPSSSDEKESVELSAQADAQAEALDNEETEYKSTVVQDTSKKLLKSTGKALLWGSSYFFNVLGLYFAFGLVLNLTGYAYEFSFKGGYKIETIENRRIRNQFEAVSKRYEKEALNQKTPSQAAIEAVAREAETPSSQ